MKTKFLSLIMLVALVAAMFGSATPAFAQTAVKEMRIAPMNIANAGDIVTVDVIARSDQPVVGIQFSLQFNPAVLQANDTNPVALGIQAVTTGPWLQAVADSVGGTLSVSPYIVDNVNGLINNYAIQVYPFTATDGATTEGVVARISFRALANGLSVNDFVGTLIMVNPVNSGAYPGVVFNAGDFRVGPAPRLEPTLVGFSPIGTGSTFTTNVTVRNTGGAPTDAAHVVNITATGATPASQSVSIPANLAAGAEVILALPTTTYNLTGANAVVTVSIPDFGTSRSSTYSMVSDGGTTTVDATFGAFIDLTVPAAVDFGQLSLGDNFEDFNINVKCNTSYNVDVTSNPANWHMAPWNGTAFVSGDALENALRIWTDGKLVSQGTAVTLLDGTVANQAGDAGETYITRLGQFLTYGDPLLPSGQTYHSILTFNAYITL